MLITVQVYFCNFANFYVSRQEIFADYDSLKLYDRVSKDI